jgi:hypothetical protein
MSMITACTNTLQLPIYLTNTNPFAEFVIFMTATMNVFWDVAQCISCKNQWFRGTRFLHLQGIRNSWAMNSIHNWLSDYTNRQKTLVSNERHSQLAIGLYRQTKNTNYLKTEKGGDGGGLLRWHTDARQQVARCLPEQMLEVCQEWGVKGKGYQVSEDLVALEPELPIVYGPHNLVDLA